MQTPPTTGTGTRWGGSPLSSRVPAAEHPIFTTGQSEPHHFLCDWCNFPSYLHIFSCFSSLSGLVFSAAMTECHPLGNRWRSGLPPSFRMLVRWYLLRLLPDSQISLFLQATYWGHNAICPTSHAPRPTYYPGTDDSPPAPPYSCCFSLATAQASAAACTSLAVHHTVHHWLTRHSSSPWWLDLVDYDFCPLAVFPNPCIKQQRERSQKPPGRAPPPRNLWRTMLHLLSLPSLGIDSVLTAQSLLTLQAVSKSRTPRERVPLGSHLEDLVADYKGSLGRRGARCLLLSWALLLSKGLSIFPSITLSCDNTVNSFPLTWLKDQ